MRVVLPSNACLENYPNNSLTKFTVQLPQPLDLSSGQWEFGLSEIQFYKSWYNVKDSILTIRKGNEETVVTMENGYYKSPDFFIHQLNEQIEKCCNEETQKFVKFSYNKVTRSSEIYFTPNKKFLLEFTPNMKHILGFNNADVNTEIEKLSQKYPARGDTPVSKLKFSTGLPMQLDDIFNLMVYCDLAQTSIVGNTEAPLLRSVPVTGKHWENQCTTFSRIQYIPVSKKSVRSISVYIYTDWGQPIAFTHGRTTCTLEFRKTHSLQHK